MRAFADRDEHVPEGDLADRFDPRRIGVDRDMSALFRRTTDVDLRGTFSLHHYRALELLFA